MKKEDLTYDSIKKVVLSKGHRFFEGVLNLNFIGIRTNNRIADNFDDFFCVLWQDRDTDGKIKNYIFVDDEFTTDPGIFYLKNKLLNPKGCAIVVPDQYRGLWKLGMHGYKNPYEAFVQVGKIAVYRDRDKDNELDGDASTIEQGYFGINQHHGYESENVGNNSAGCQVHKHKETLKSIIELFKTTIEFHGETISYTLLTENDFPQ